MIRPLHLSPHLAVSELAGFQHDRLIANAHKSGWDEMSREDLIIRLREELAELEDVLIGGTDEEIVAEAADVANFAAFAAWQAMRREEDRDHDELRHLQTRVDFDDDLPF